ncbi:MAG TPA: alkaline phosphatase family protein [Vicinamibacterales bacterium]|jgi:predicted AlkP superfamily phosphohydrolase/phosphomutase
MRFLRMLTNSLLAGALGAAYLTILVLQLNPQVPLFSGTVWRWYTTLGAFYGIHLAVLFYVTMVLREFVSLDVFSPGWVSVRLLAWLSAAAAAVAAVLMWLNLRGLPAVFNETASHRFAVGAGATTASAIVLLGIAVAHYSFGRRGSKVGAALLVIAITGSLALPLAARGVGGDTRRAPRPTTLSTTPANTAVPHVIVMLLDGASLEFVWPRAAEGRLPNFGRLLDGGASLDLATIRPTQADPVWAAVATGMYPAKNGVRSATSYYARGDDRPIDLLPDHCFSQALVSLGVVRDEPKSSAAWRAPPIWSVLDDYGISSGIVRWPLTYPAEPVRGFLVSDRFHALFGTMFEIDGRAAYPADVQPVVHDAFAGSEGSTTDVVAAGATMTTGPAREVALGRWDQFYGRAMHDLLLDRPVTFSAIRYQGVDTIGHYYLRYAQPRAFGDVSDEERLKYGAVLERYYAYIDGQIGTALDHLAPGDLLLVVSGFGLEPVSPIKHLLGRVLREADLSGTHEHAPDGFLLAYGTAVAPGRYQRGSIVDVTPTILYFLGLPVGRDMDGFARADIFSRTFTAERPITFIPSHGR